MIPQSTRLRVKNFKSYGEAGLSLDEFKHLNLVIGRNNTGKSALLDAIEHLCAGTEVAATHYHKGRPSVFSHIGRFQAASVRSLFSESTSGGWIGGNHWTVVGQNLVKDSAEVTLLTGKSAPEVLSHFPSDETKLASVRDGRLLESPHLQQNLSQLAQSVPNPFSGFQTIRLSAERDVIPESRSSELSLRPNGVGLTNILTQVITSAKYDSRIVEQTMLQTINEILYPDIHIDGIKVQEHESQAWEIFLDQSDKGNISLSNSGSGLKTVILTVAALQLLSTLHKKNISRTVYLLEELENNLHPAMQRRLMKYVDDFVKSNDSMAVVTTHSSAMIDMFSRSETAQIIHIGQHTDGSATAVVANTHITRSGILDDLDVRASDILQSNGVVWVEGPSDRIYINRWISLITDGLLEEGTHYQCVFYGGRLLSHLSANPDDEGDWVQILRVARNAVVVMDSDNKDQLSAINKTKRRMREEVEAVGGLSWVTEGREIENYISASILSRIDTRFKNDIGPFDEIEIYLESVLGTEDAKKLIRSKAVFAELVSQHMLKQDIVDRPTLYSEVEKLATVIAGWNGLTWDMSLSPA